MDKKKYFESVLDYLDNLSDEEFDVLLIEAGIENCPYEDFIKKKLNTFDVLCDGA